MAPLEHQLLLTSFAVVVCVGVNQGQSCLLMSAQWLGCLHKPSTMEKVIEGQGTGEQVLSADEGPLVK